MHFLSITGAEVAKYCELHFPDFVKKMMTANTDEDLSKIIQSAFLDFDATLVEEDVVKRLKELAGRDDGNEEEEDGKGLSSLIHVWHFPFFVRLCCFFFLISSFLRGVSQCHVIFTLFFKLDLS